MRTDQSPRAAGDVAASLAQRYTFLRLDAPPIRGGVRLVALHVGPVSESIPALSEDVLTLQREGRCTAEVVLDQRFAPRISAPGALAIIPRGTPSSWITNGTVTQLHLWLPPTFLAAVALEVYGCDPAHAALCPCVAASDPLLYQIGLALFDEVQGGAAAEGLYVEALIHTLGAHLIHRHTAAAPPLAHCQRGLTRPALQRVLDYIEDHLACELSLAELASITGYSVFHFTRLFKQTTGLSVHTYVTERRVEAARNLICSGEFTVAEAAALVGFHDQSHLCRHFKQCYGFSPSALLHQRTNLPQDRTNLQAPDR